VRKEWIHWFPKISCAYLFVFVWGGLRGGGRGKGGGGDSVHTYELGYVCSQTCMHHRGPIPNKTPTSLSPFPTIILPPLHIFITPYNPPSPYPVPHKYAYAHAPEADEEGEGVLGLGAGEEGHDPGEWVR
jgi:hypothetical protein